MGNNNCVLIGLPKSGKSTFVAALWHVVESKELNSSLIIDSLPEERTYLNEIRDNWLSCSDFDRNKAEYFKKISLDIFDKNTKNQTLFNFPDIMGEMFDLQFDTRNIANDFVEILRTSNAIMLFVNPDLLQKPRLIWSVGKIDGDEEAEESKKKWTYKDTPTQVVLVDLLQMVEPNLNIPLKIAIIISAWDTVMSVKDPEYAKLTPDEWIEKEMPLLKQFLDTNSDIYKSTYFGVSAQGGNYKEDKVKLNNFDHQSERIKIQEGSNVGNDITIPVRWLINE